MSPELDKATKDAVAVVQKCVADTTAAYQASYAKVTAGKYTVDDWFKDVTTVWSVAVRDASTLMNLGVQAAQSMAESAGTTATGKPTAKATKATGKST
jgi:hypothetical protein